MQYETDAPRMTRGSGRAHRAPAAVMVAVVLVTAGAVLMVGAGPAGAATVSGSVEITQPGGSAALDAGGSATDFGLALPSGATCPGDSAHQGYHVFSFMVPKGVSPTTTNFTGAVPSRYFGFIAYGTYYYGASNTAENTGQIMNVPTSFNWTRLTPQILFPAGATSSTWTGGVACADEHGTITNYWTTEITFNASSTDPGGFTWTVDHPVTVVPSTFPWRWILLGLGILLVVLAVVIRIGQGRGEGVEDGGADRQGGTPGRGDPAAPAAPAAPADPSAPEEVDAHVDA